MLLVVALVVAEMKFECLDRGKGLGLWMVDHVLDMRLLTSATAVTYYWRLTFGKQAGAPLMCYGVERVVCHGFAATIDALIVGCRSWTGEVELSRDVMCPLACATVGG